MTDLPDDDVLRQAIHELTTAVAWLAHASHQHVGTETIGQILAKCHRVDQLLEVPRG